MSDGPVPPTRRAAARRKPRTCACTGCAAHPGACTWPGTFAWRGGRLCLRCLRTTHPREKTI